MTADPSRDARDLQQRLQVAAHHIGRVLSDPGSLARPASRNMLRDQVDAAVEATRGLEQLLDQIESSGNSQLDECVLWELPLDAPGARWLLASQVADRVDVALNAAEASLDRLAAGLLAAHDGESPRRWARPVEPAPGPSRPAA